MAFAAVHTSPHVMPHPNFSSSRQFSSFAISTLHAFKASSRLDRPASKDPAMASNSYSFGMSRSPRSPTRDLAYSLPVLALLITLLLASCTPPALWPNRRRTCPSCWPGCRCGTLGTSRVASVGPAAGRSGGHWRGGWVRSLLIVYFVRFWIEDCHGLSFGIVVLEHILEVVIALFVHHGDAADVLS